MGVEVFDHCLLFLKMVNQTGKFNRPLCFLKAWTTNKTSEEVVEQAWQFEP